MANRKIDMGVGHWSAGVWTPNQIEMDDYHFGIVWDPVKGEARFEKWNDYDEILSHCWKENSHSIGGTICGMANANEWNFGKYPMKGEQVKALCIAFAEAFCILNIPSSGFFTHAERAFLNPVENYENERWDLGILRPGEINREIKIKTGDLLRRDIHDYILEIKAGKRKINPLHYENKFRGKKV